MQLIHWTMIGLGLYPALALSPPSHSTLPGRSSAPNNFSESNDRMNQCDVLVLGAGAAGIAAALELKNQGYHPIVLEARNRVGGRAHTSDELKVGLPLDHGAKWLHGASPQNRMVQLLEQTDALQRVPSFVPLSDSSESSSVDSSDLSSDESSETLDDVAEMDPTKTTTRLLRKDPTTQQITASEPCPLAKTVAQTLFSTVMEMFDHPTGLLGTSEPDMSLLELLSNTTQLSFWKNSPAFQSALQSIAARKDQEAFQHQVEALLYLEMNQFFDNWEGAPIDRVSARHGLEGTILDGGNALLSGGYGGRIEELARPLFQDEIIRLGHEIQSIQTKDDGVVQVVCQVGTQIELFQAPACIVTLPLGVLKTNQIQFDPPLPSSIQTSIQNLGVAIMNKVELSFPYPWWQPGMERFTLACSHLNQGPSYHPWTSFIVEAATGGQNIMVCYLHGDFAKDTEQKSNDEIQKECMEVLRKADLAISGSSIPDPLAIHVTRWFQDPHSRGCWTYYAKNSGAKDARIFREDVECHKRGLYFAGEHTCDGSIPGLDLGCVHGAWLSGELAAAAAIQQMEANEVSCGKRR